MYVQSARIIKGRIEMTTLQGVCTSIEEVFLPGTCYISIRLNTKTIDALQLQVDAYTVRDAILKSKSKLKVTTVYWSSIAELV